MTTDGAFYQEFRPTLWHRLGFRRRHNETVFQWRMQEPQEDGLADGYMISETHAHFDWIDRLRLLITGHAEIIVYTKADVIPKRLVSRSEVSVLP